MLGRKRKLIKKMLSGVNLVKMGLYVRLKSNLTQEYDEDFSEFLAAAIINELFSETPSNPEGIEFLSSNKELVHQEIDKLKHDEKIRNAVTQAVRVKAIILLANNQDHSSSHVQPLEKLKDLGILIPGGEPPTPETLLAMARDFSNQA